MPPLADPLILAQFVAVLDNWNVTGYVTAKGIVLDWIADNLPGHDLRSVAKLIHDHVHAGGRPDQVRERRPEYDDRDYHYDFRLTISGRQRQVYIETILVDDDPSDPTLHIVSMHDAGTGSASGEAAKREALPLALPEMRSIGGHTGDNALPLPAETG